MSFKITTELYESLVLEKKRKMLGYEFQNNILVTMPNNGRLKKVILKCESIPWLKTVKNNHKLLAISPKPLTKGYRLIAESL